MPIVLQKIQWKKSMKWGDFDLNWGRPLKSILAIFDKKKLIFNFHHLTSSNSTFLDKTVYFGEDLMNKAVSRGAAFGDIDNDGDPDFIISNNNGRAAVFYNSGKPKNNWIGFELQGEKTNRDAIGSKILLKTKSGIQTSWVNPASSYLTSNDKRVLFGIGNDDMILSLEIYWAGSKQENFVNLKPGFYYKIIQGKLPFIIDYNIH